MQPVEQHRLEKDTCLRAALPHPQGPIGGRAGMPMTLPVPSKIFTIFEGTSEIQRMLIGRTVTGLDVR
jgi:alkylation response protein AidB-like acyl-CoA dehydrogenase